MDEQGMILMTKQRSWMDPACQIDFSTLFNKTNDSPTLRAGF